MAESKRIDLALKQDCAGILLVLSGKSKLFLAISPIGVEEKAVAWSMATYQVLY